MHPCHTLGTTTKAQGALFLQPLPLPSPPLHTRAVDWVAVTEEECAAPHGVLGPERPWCPGPEPGVGESAANFDSPGGVPPAGVSPADGAAPGGRGPGGASAGASPDPDLDPAPDKPPTLSPARPASTQALDALAASVFGLDGAVQAAALQGVALALETPDPKGGAATWATLNPFVLPGVVAALEVAGHPAGAAAARVVELLLGHPPAVVATVLAFPRLATALVAAAASGLATCREAAPAVMAPLSALRLGLMRCPDLGAAVAAAPELVIALVRVGMGPPCPLSTQALDVLVAATNTSRDVATTVATSPGTLAALAAGLGSGASPDPWTAALVASVVRGVVRCVPGVLPRLLEAVPGGLRALTHHLGGLLSGGPEVSPHATVAVAAMLTVCTLARALGPGAHGVWVALVPALAGALGTGTPTRVRRRAVFTLGVLLYLDSGVGLHPEAATAARDLVAAIPCGLGGPGGPPGPPPVEDLGAVVATLLGLLDARGAAVTATLTLRAVEVCTDLVRALWRPEARVHAKAVFQALQAVLTLSRNPDAALGVLSNGFLACVAKEVATPDSWAKAQALSATAVVVRFAPPCIVAALVPCTDLPTALVGVLVAGLGTPAEAAPRGLEPLVTGALNVAWFLLVAGMRLPVAVHHACTGAVGVQANGARGTWAAVPPVATRVDTLLRSVCVVPPHPDAPWLSDTIALSAWGAQVNNTSDGCRAFTEV